MPNLEATLAELEEHKALDMEAGGPGSGRHKTGISMQEKTSVMHLRRQGFKFSKKASVGKTHGYTRQDTAGNLHSVNLSKSGFTHHVASAQSVGMKAPRFKQVGAGKHSELDSHMMSQKPARPNSSTKLAMNKKTPKF